MRSDRILLAVTLLGQVALALPGGAQEAADVQAYFRAAGEHFGVPVAEMTILSEWDLPPEHVPVVIFLARRAGISPDALVAMKRGGRSWADLAARYGIDAAAFHVPLSEGASAGSLDRAYRAYAETPRAGWPSIRLTDEEIVALVNLRFLSEQMDTAPERVLRVREQAGGSFVTTYRVLVRAGG